MSQASEGNLYHLILGLPEDVTSPNHYELLGLDHRTADSTVINNAAADQNRKLLHWQNSDRYAEVKALTFELVQARDVLLKGESRAAYDATLGDWGLEDQGPWIENEPRRRTNTPPPLSVRCPECEASFKLRNRDLIGERIPCPECGVRFTVRPEEHAVALAEPEAIPLAEPADSDADLNALEDFDDMDGRPSSRNTTLARTERQRKADRDLFSVEPYRDDDRRSPRAKRPSRPSAVGNAGKKAAIAGAALMALGCLILAGIWIVRSSPSSASVLKQELAYLHPDCQSLAYYRIGDVARSPVFQDHLTHSPQALRLVDYFRDRTGMELSEIDSVVVGVKDRDLGRFNSLGFSPHLPELKFVAVARAAKDWDRAKLIGTHSQSASHGNHTYHTYLPEPYSAQPWAFCLVDARTLIFGTIDDVKAALDTNGKTPDWPDVDFLQPDYPIVNANIGGSSSFRPVSLPIPVRPDASARTQGSGLMLSSAEVRQVTFVRFESSSDAARFVEDSEKWLQNRRPFQMPQASRPVGGVGGMTFTQHGLTVAAAYQSNGGSVAGHMLGQAVSPAVALLSRLGESPMSQANQPNQNPQPAPPVANPIANLQPRQNIAAEPLGPMPDAATLTSLIARLQNPDEAKDAARQLATMQPDPNRQKQVARLLEAVVSQGGHFDKQAAADALGIWGSSDNVPFLLGFLQNPTQGDTFLNRHILVALGRLKDARALPVLIDSLKNVHLRSDAGKGLTYYGAAAEPELLKALAANDWQQQQAICNVLRDIGTAQSLPALDDLSATGHTFVKSHAQSAAAAIRAAGT
jgi:hypothetical protein